MHGGACSCVVCKLDLRRVSNIFTTPSAYICIANHHVARLVDFDRPSNYCLCTYHSGACRAAVSFVVGTKLVSDFYIPLVLGFAALVPAVVLAVLLASVPEPNVSIGASNACCVVPIHYVFVGVRVCVCVCVFLYTQVCV